MLAWFIQQGVFIIFTRDMAMVQCKLHLYWIALAINVLNPLTYEICSVAPAYRTL